MHHPDSISLHFRIENNDVEHITPRSLGLNYMRPFWVGNVAGLLSDILNHRLQLGFPPSDIQPSQQTKTFLARLIARDLQIVGLEALPLLVSH